VIALVFIDGRRGRGPKPQRVSASRTPMPPVACATGDAGDAVTQMVGWLHPKVSGRRRADSPSIKV
jgi:hypothetical protein